MTRFSPVLRQLFRAFCLNLPGKQLHESAPLRYLPYTVRNPGAEAPHPIERRVKFAMVGIRPGNPMVSSQNLETFMAESRNSAAAVNSRPDPNEKLVKVFDTEQESEALVVKGLLESSGIDSDITALSAPQDTFPGVGGTIILVREEDAEAARRVIAEFRQPAGAADDETAEYDAVDDEAMADSTGEPPQKG